VLLNKLSSNQRGYPGGIFLVSPYTGVSKESIDNFETALNFPNPFIS
jgi:hypothetical protein